MAGPSTPTRVDHQAGGRNALATTVGMALMLAGLLCNEWLVAKVMSPDGRIESRTFRIAIGSLDATLILLGVVLATQRGRALLRALVLRPLRRHPNVAAFLIGCAIALAMAAMVESFFFLRLAEHMRLRADADCECELPQGLFIADDVAGYRLPPDASARDALTCNGEVVYDVEYQTDRFGCRVTPVDDSVPRTRFAILLGGSFTFGQRVDGDETLAAQLGRLAPIFHPYNLGCPGYGPQCALERVRFDPLDAQIAEARGIAIYVFIDDHVDRAIGTMRVTNAWSTDMPYFTMSRDGELSRNGFLRPDRPWRTWIYRMLAKSYTVQETGFDWPPWRGENAFELTARLVIDCRDVLAERLDLDGFYVLLYPGQPDGRRLIPWFEREGVTYLDYVDLFDAAQPEWIVPRDGHPSAKAYATLAQQIVADLHLATSGL